ncbi:MAG: UDP-N-acetylmuramoyl-L-alanyl-D-glutamate--2,6-diaminopimelate ligase [Bacteroidales bacterium]|nr:UDP-N-acetylmuramoyl-L-alanyl-D-glutamate--2,6-diaminopimelate ligase [Bacteroidales bacterium]MCB9012993.1 UDP-N-acetylmuramoyl-L-alanyl-D-glutamate--2,6-diaminopimelate ligase [Bacteroidales bacterium]
MGDPDTGIANLCFDSRKAGKGDLFFALKGTQSDGHLFIPELVKKGVSAVVCEDWPDINEGECTVIQVLNSHEALAQMASEYYGRPSEKLQLVGVTGTNGKTTIATLLYHLFTGLGYKCGLISTIKTEVAGKSAPASHTTPDPLQINSLLKEMTEAGCEYAFMEVSSHAAHQRRIGGLRFAGGIFTNLTHDHLDYHKTFRDYLMAKKMFFDALPPDAFALMNADDKNSKILTQNCKAKIHSYSLKAMSDFKGKIAESYLEGNLIILENKELWTQLPGVFNAYNILAIYGAARLLNADKDEVSAGISKLQSVAGRFEVMRSESGTTAIVDYAHTPDALENVLKTIREIRNGENRIITIVGAGGNRDKTKRPLMARIAASLSDKLILTSDNPRDEEPETIINDMKTGLDPVLERKAISITDREEAIRATCSFAESTDIILLAGKGHETYQEIKGVKHHFDDKEMLRKYLINK